MTFSNAKDAVSYTLAGKGKITLTSQASGKSFTYKVDQIRNRETNELEQRWFVKVLTGPDNWANYTYAGMIGDDHSFRLTKGSKLSEDAPSVKAFAYFWRHALEADRIAPHLEVRHEGTCGKCGRLLTVPESIDAGIGPECRKMMGQ